MYYVIFGLLGAALLGADQWVKAWVVGRLLPDPLRRHWQYHRPIPAGLCGGYAPLPILAQLSHVQRGGCVHRVRGHSGRDLLCIDLRKA